MRIFTLALFSLIINLTLAFSQASPPVSVTVDHVQSVSCFAMSDGIIEITANGGTGSLTYEWSNGKQTEDIDQLFAGTYRVTVTDATGASVLSPNITIQQPEIVAGQLDFVQNLSCADAEDGAINVVMYGGTPPYTFEWSNGETDQNLENLPMGDYTFTATDAMGCTWESPSVPITQPNAIVIYETISDATEGNSDGHIAIDLNGGLPPYQFEWDNGAITQNLENVPNGQYCLTITDAYDCVVVQCYEIGGVVSNENITDTFNHFTIAPNPASDVVVIDVEFKAVQNSLIRVLDITGRVIDQYEFDNAQQVRQTIATSHYTPGNYFIMLELNGETIAKKLAIR